MGNVRTGIAFRKEFLSHETGEFHPETPVRLASILDSLSSLGTSSFQWESTFSPAPLDILSLSHNVDYISHVKELCENQKKGYLDGDTPFSEESFLAASLGSAAGIHLLQKVESGELQNGMVLVRPPGHHAEEDHAMGFCFFNHIAIAAEYLKSHGKKRIVILDWDVHHGNGTQNHFYSDPNVFFISLHQAPFYPGSGSREERGKGPGLGTTLNFPLPRGSEEKDILACFAEIHREMETFKPDFVLVSAGFDGHKMDPLGGWNLSTNSYEKITKETQKIAKMHCQGKLVSFLEGGYHLQALAESVKTHLEVLATG